MKKYTYILFFAALLGACNKDLQIEPANSLDAGEAINSPESVDAAIVGAYSILAGGALYGTDLLMVPDLLAQDDYLSWRGTFTSFRQVANKSMTRDNAESLRIWQKGYQAINMANIVLGSLDLVTDPDLHDQLEGEAYFIRGIVHFELVRFFGLPWGATTDNSHPGVVIKTTATHTSEQAFQKTARSSVKDVYAQVIDDLTKAADLLPEENDRRATRYTAIAFLSRVYLQQHNYEGARDAADEVIASDLFKMNAAVTAVFDNKNTTESIFEIQQNDQNNAGVANDGMATFYASFSGIGRADVRMVDEFLSLYDEDDSRLSNWYYEGTGSRPGNMYCGKWKSFSQNLPVIRIAEMYLTRAECNERLGTSVGDTPENDLEKIVNPVRVNLPAIANPALQDILDQRYLELAFEGVRIHDIKRLKLSTGDYEWNDNRLVLPIPQVEVGASEGTITQNPGY